MAEDQDDQDQQSTSELLAAYGATKFRFIDTSSCESTHSPKDREDHEVSEERGKDEGSLGNARRGHTKIVSLDDAGNKTIVGYAKRNDKPIFDEAEKVLKAAIREATSLIQRYSIKVGGARAVPSTRYAEFRSARDRCREIASETNQHPAVIAANRRLREEKRDLIHITYTPNLFPELSLSDPEDLERAERIKSSVAEAIALVCDACRSGDRDKIRYVVEQVGALGDAISDPTRQAEIKSLLKLADKTVEAITARGRAAGATMRSNPGTTKAQEAADRFLAAQATESELKTELNVMATSIFQLVEAEANEIMISAPEIMKIELDEIPVMTREDEIAAMVADLDREKEEFSTDLSGIEL